MCGPKRGSFPKMRVPGSAFRGSITAFQIIGASISRLQHGSARGLPLKARAFGCAALVLVTLMRLLFILWFARLALRPSAFFGILAGRLRFGFRGGLSTTFANCRKIPANLPIHFQNHLNIAKPLGYCKRKRKLF